MRPSSRRPRRCSSSLLGTPLFIRFLVKRGYGQFIRDDGPTSHHTKRGTPTMGGAVIIGGDAGRLLRRRTSSPGDCPPRRAVLVLFLMTGLGVVGFLDDFIKISRQRSLGLRPRAEARRAGRRRRSRSPCSSLQFPNEHVPHAASTQISFIRDTGFDLAFAGRPRSHCS